MIVVLKSALEKDVEKVVSRIEDKGFKTIIQKGVEKIVINAIGLGDKDRNVLMEQLQSLDCVENVIPILKPYKIVAKECNPKGSKIKVGNLTIGGDKIIIMAGPCAVESEEQLIETAKKIKKAGGHILRGGAFKPRTSPYSFQGLKKKGLQYLKLAKEITGLPVISEIMDVRDLHSLEETIDILQVGTRNMQNFVLLKEVGKSKKPVLLKRGLSATLEEFLMAAEYIASEGNTNIIMCERGIRTFETYTRNTLDLSVVPAVKELSHLPIIVDPSHGTGRWRLVSHMAKAAVAAGADGLMVEVHLNPSQSLSDGPQTLSCENFEKLMQELKEIVKVFGKRI